MTIREKESNARVCKILRGLEITYEKLVADKKAKNGELVVLRNNKITVIKP